MKILIEHIVTAPYCPASPQGGTERFSHQVLMALRNSDIHADMFCSEDTDNSVQFIRKSGTLSTEGIRKSGKRSTDLEGYITSLNEVAKDYDYVLLSSPFSSHALFRDWEFFKKATLINHLCYPSIITGEAGFRFQLAARWMQQCGGRCVSSGATNFKILKELWDTPHKRQRIVNNYRPYVERCEIDLTRPLFEGWFDVNILPDDRAPVAKINQQKIVAVGRPVREKQILSAVKAMEILQTRGFDCHVFITDFGNDFDAIKNSSINVHVNEPHASILQHVAEARCVLFPSTSETNGIVAFEAASHGVPVIYQCDEADFFLQEFGVGLKFEPVNGKTLINTLVEMTESVSQTDEERAVARAKVDAKYSDGEFTKRLLGIFPGNSDPNAVNLYEEPVRVIGRIVETKDVIAQKSKILQPNEVDYAWVNFDDIPSKTVGKKQIYAILIEDKVIGVGETNDMRERIPNGYAYCTKTNRQDGSSVITYMQKIADQNGNKLSFEAMFIEQCDTGTERERESYWIEVFKTEGHPVQNKTKAVKSKAIKPVKEKKEPKVKVPKEPKVKAEKVPKEPKGDGRGGWAVHPKHYGTGKMLRSYFDGAWWTAKHDDIVDDVNASLAAGGKQTLIENPRPFSASSGLRGGDKYWSKE